MRLRRNPSCAPMPTCEKWNKLAPNGSCHLLSCFVVGCFAMQKFIHRCEKTFFEPQKIHLKPCGTWVSLHCCTTVHLRFMHRFSTAAKGRAENRACLADRTYLGQAAWSVLKAALDVCW